MFTHNMKNRAVFYGEKPVSIVLGLDSITSLGVARNLSKHKIPVVALTKNKFSFSCFSKRCIAVESVHTDDDLLNILVDIGNTARYKPVIFCESDRYLLFIDRYKDILCNYFHCFLPGRHSLSEIINKTTMHKLAGEAGLDVPVSFYSGEHAFDSIKTQISYPCIIKPVYTQHGHQTKGAVAHNEAALLEYTASERFSPGYIVQEIIQGPERNLTEFIGYFDQSSQPLATFSGYKVRQIPPDYGTATVAVSKKNIEIEELSITFLKSIGYHGLANVEFKLNQNNGKYTFIEVNPRACFWGELTAAAGVNFPYIAYCDVTGMYQGEKPEQKDGVQWISVMDDFKSCLLYYRKQEKRVFFDWLKRSLQSDAYAIFSLTDIKPFLVKIFTMMLNPVLKLLKRCQQR